MTIIMYVPNLLKLKAEENCQRHKCKTFSPHFAGNLSFNYEKVKACHGKENNCDYWRPKVNDTFNSVWTNHSAKHNTQGQWSKILTIVTLAWRMQMWKSWRKILTMSCRDKKSHINATSATLHLLIQAVWGDIWKRTVEKSRTTATNVTLPLIGHTCWGYI